MDVKYICDALRDKLNDCQCAAYGRCECGCGAVWPEDVASGAADLIESQAATIARLTTENERLREEKKSSPFWLIGFLCEPYDGKPCEWGDHCQFQQLCVTESCHTCAANWWLKNYNPHSKAALAAQPSDAEVSDG